ncbi:glycoside hydrolase family 5 protein [Granulosicoccus sp.]|nr:glycoside hydrolase family 5 protein [Granulosicoccus sp.]MDB4224405.1 glycoside hydrolase family 5 protein [Granulosicoccus sp.]
MTLSVTSVIFLVAALPFVVCAASLNKPDRVESVIGQITGVGKNENYVTHNSPEKSDQKSIFALNTLLGRGINLSGLEQASEGDWNFKLNIDALSIIADGNFNSVRLPIKWDSRAAAIGSDMNGTYPIEQAFFNRVDSVVQEALSEGLRVIINMHLYEDLINDPIAESERFLNLWDQIAKHYSEKPDSVYFEILNEPAAVFSEKPQLWNKLLAQALQTIRISNPDRAVIVGPVGWNLIGNLKLLKLPDDDRLIVSVHYYDPGHFTHQGAEWVHPMLPVGADWLPQRQRLGSELQNWSWDTDVEFGDHWVEATFARSGAALNLYTQPKNFPNTMSVRLSGFTKLAIICGAESKFTDTEIRLIHNSTKWATFEADLSNCPNNANQIAIQNLVEGGGTVSLRGGEFCKGKDCRPFFMSEHEAIEMAFESARQWGESEHRPMNLGEFGAYNRADMGSRALWTKSVQQAAQARGMSSHYWEFDRGFGVWDRKSGRWVQPLYRALQP